MNFVKRLWARVPAFVKKDGARALLLFGAAFVVTAKPLVPALLATPSFGEVKSLVVAGILAGARSAQPVGVKLVVQAAYKIVQAAEASKPAPVVPDLRSDPPVSPVVPVVVNATPAVAGVVDNPDGSTTQVGPSA